MGASMNPAFLSSCLDVADREWKATIDTGFNGDLELPIALYPHVNPRFLATASSYLAADKMVMEGHYIIDFPFDDLGSGTCKLTRSLERAKTSCDQKRGQCRR